MKASQAIAILEALDPNYEVTLILGVSPNRLPNIPKWNTNPVYPYKDYWIKSDELDPFKITCGPITAYKQ